MKTMDVRLDIPLLAALSALDSTWSPAWAWLFSFDSNICSASFTSPDMLAVVFCFVLF